MIRLREKGGKTIDLPAHHNLVEWLDEYVEAAGIKNERKKPPFTQDQVARISYW